MYKIFLLLFLFLSQIIHAQTTYSDLALLYSRNNISGTARSIGSAGAFGSVGADLGSVAINPAGIGLYRSTDISITPSLQIGNNEAQFNGSVTNTPLTRIYFNQAGVAFTKLLKSASSENDFSFNSNNFRSFTFAINYQRQNMLSRTQNFDGYNSSNSAIQFYSFWLNSTNQVISPENYPIELILARQVDLIRYDSVSDTYYSRAHAPILQEGSMTTRGAVDQVDLAFGGNVSDKFYFGVGLGFSILTYQQNSSFSEFDAMDTIRDFQDYTINSSLRETGLGVNSKFGVIYRPLSWMRLGLAYHIPTFYGITENYYTDILANYDTFYYSLPAEAAPLRYKMRTPMKGVASASFYYKENGFFSVDYEFLNYGSSRFNFGSEYKSESEEVNTYQKQNYTFGHVIRAGIEGAYKTLRLRAGYSFSYTPYKKDKFLEGYAEVKHNASIGGGYRGKRFYADFAYLFGIMKNADYPYADFEVKNINLTHNIYITFGWKISKENTRVSRKETLPKEF